MSERIADAAATLAACCIAALMVCGVVFAWATLARWVWGMVG